MTKKLIFLVIIGALVLTPFKGNAGFWEILDPLKVNGMLFGAGLFSGKKIVSEINEDLFERNGESFSLITQNDSLIAVNSPVTPKTYKPKRTYVVAATAYSSTPEQTDHTPFITAAGTHVRDGVVAANFLPLGTIIKIPDIFGDKTFVVEDRMNDRYWMNIDIWFPEKVAAKHFGVKIVKIEIL